MQQHWKRAASALLVAASATLAACRDDVGAPTLPVVGRPSLDFVATNAPPAGTNVGLYWHHTDTLWAYDKRPEVGINVHIAVDQQLTQVQQLGMKLARIAMHWPEVDPTGTASQSAYNATRLQYHEYQVTKALELGLEPVFVVHSSRDDGVEPSFFTFSEDPNNPVNQHFAQFMGHMATRFAGRVRYWQLFNEMDAPGWTRLFGNQAGKSKIAQGWHYAQMLKLAYPAIKAADPNAWVLTGGLTGLGDGSPAPRDYQFLHGIYNGGGKHYFDFLAVHSYGGKGPAPVDSAGIEMIRHLSWNRDSGRPVWLTEFGTSASLYVAERGYYPHWYGLDDAATYDSAQVNFWRGALGTHQTSGHFVKMLGYALFAVDGGPPQIANANTLDYTFGLLRADEVTPRPVYNELAAGNFNAFVHGTPTRVVDVDVTFDGRDPISYASTLIGGNILRIHNVTVDSRKPTKIAFSGARGSAASRVCYEVWNRNVGWSGARCDGAVAGQEWQSTRPVEALRVWLQSPQPGAGICYRVHRTGDAWGAGEACDGAVIGVPGDSKHMEAIKVRLTGASPGTRVCYQVHHYSLGWWQGTRCDGVIGGSEGLSRAMAAVWIKLTA